MTRETKFRAWDRVGNKMWNVTTMEFANNDEFTTRYGLEPRIVFTAVDAEGNRFYGSNIECYLIESTGIKDKHGLVEVYEHDLVQVMDGMNTWITHVKFDSERGLWHRHDDYAAGQVIGNCYEHPALSKEAR